MDKKIILLLLLTLLFPLISADITIQEEPEELYQIGEFFSIPVIISSDLEVTGTIEMDLICDNKRINYYKNGVGLLANQEKTIEPLLVLTKENIGSLKGDCKIRGTFRGESVTTENFEISDKINILATVDEKEFSPGETLVIEGTALKENQENVNGYIELELTAGSLSNKIKESSTVKEGKFEISVELPEDIPAGIHSVKLTAYELDSDDEKTNQGESYETISVKQIPTSLEIVLDEEKIIPGNSIKAKIILHDQTGEKIPSNAIITIKDQKDDILQQIEKPTEEYLEYFIKSNEEPGQWKVVAVSNKITSEKTFNIAENSEIAIELIEGILVVENIGNVAYNDTIDIDVGDQKIPLDIFLKLGESKKYSITAPDGEYEINVDENGENLKSGTVILTGNAFKIEEVQEGVVKIVRHPISWIFMAAILFFVVFILFKRVRKKSFLGYKGKFKQMKMHSEKKSDFLLEDSERAELSLSIKGNEQNSSVVCLKIKNLNEIKNHKDAVKETLKKITSSLEEFKVAVYENQENIFFIFAPVKTKTFNNEKLALRLANRIIDILKEHNRIFKVRIDFGIALNSGATIAKMENGVLKFMSKGNFAIMSKKLASMSKGDLLISEKTKNNLTAEAKFNDHKEGNLKYYTIKEKKNSEANKDFIAKFLHRNK